VKKEEVSGLATKTNTASSASHNSVRADRESTSSSSSYVKHFPKIRISKFVKQNKNCAIFNYRLIGQQVLLRHPLTAVMHLEPIVMKEVRTTVQQSLLVPEEVPTLLLVTVKNVTFKAVEFLRF
jgi:hypothetical protein